MESVEQREELPDWQNIDHWYPLYLRYHTDLERSRIESRKNFLATLQIEEDESELTQFMRMINGAHGMTTLKDEVEADIFRKYEPASREAFDEWWKHLEPDIRQHFMHEYTMGLAASVKEHSGAVRAVLSKYFTGDQDPSLS